MKELEKAKEQEKIREHLYQGGAEDSYNKQVAYMKGHKEACQRFLERVIKIPISDPAFTRNNLEYDLKETIKFYEERGIE